MSTNSTLIIDTNHSGFTNLIGAVAMILSIVQMTGFITIILEGLKRNQLKLNLEINHIYFLIAETGLWWIYGIKVMAFPVYLSNMALFFIYLAGVVSLYWVEKDNINIAKHAGVSIISWILGYSLISMNLAGFAAFIIKIITCYFVGIKIKASLEKKSCEGIDVNELYSGIAGYAVWVLYGLFFAHYPFVWIPNLAYFFLYFMYLFTYFWINGKITDEGILIIYTKKLFQVENTNSDYDPKQMKKKLNEDF